MSSRSGGNSTGLSRRYETALKEHLSRGRRGGLQSAGKLGREALAAGLGTVALARIHRQALIRLVPLSSVSTRRDGIVGRAGVFLVEALTPIEKAHLAAVKGDGHLARLNVTMRRRIVELAAAHRLLKLEVSRRLTVQDALEKSKEHYGHLLQRSRRMQEHLRRLSHELLAAQEEERLKISRELHDEVGQTLTAINVKLATLRKEATVNTSDLKKKIASTQRLVERSMNTVHRFARELRPPLLDDMGLIPALHSYMKGFTKRTGIPIHFKTFAELERLDSDKRTVLYRVAQEALTNVAKHARASLVEVSIQRRPGVCRLAVHDNGKSFNAQRLLIAPKFKRLGLLGMRERVEMVGGSFAVDSAPGKGTTIRAEIPFGRGL